MLLYGCDPNRAMRAKSPKSTSSGSESDEDRDGLPPTHELIELAPPGIEQVISIQECLGPKNSNQKQRSLRKEFSAGKSDGDQSGDDEDKVCSLSRGLTAAVKIFSNAK